MDHLKNKKGTAGLIGIGSSLYMALAYITGIIIFIAVLKYPSITEDMDKVRILVDMKTMVFSTNLLMYVLFGPILVLFILYLRSKLSDDKSVLVGFSSVVGYIWAGSLTASGMIANGAIEPIIKLFQVDPDQAVFLWRMFDTVSLSIGNGNGEILGGLMTLGFGMAMVKDPHLSRGLGIFGIIIGLIGVISLIPGLVDLAVIFGLMQLVWFVLTGFSSLKKSDK
ncbi:hypothetical protein [Spirochaeta isovalerica]|uniref:DUF4386 domain-containing protein n=1 Tax=Spirochaeta isovalerica TaxID=150 RepID=A0A841RB13_9SPIO|nr:hypothetical protein [Spirochaeta isovalerica]MBB6479868.1 hypothetical protein [Spirochaeta isovalerica]